MASRPVGRPRALTDDKKQQVLAFLSAGGSRKKAAAYVGVSVTTLADEARRDEEFADQLEKAEASCYMRHLQNVSKAGADDWRASAFLLERKWPGEFARTTNTNLGGQPQNPVLVAPPPQFNRIEVNTREEAAEYFKLRDMARHIREANQKLPEDYRLPELEDFGG